MNENSELYDTHFKTYFSNYFNNINSNIDEKFLYISN